MELLNIHQYISNTKRNMTKSSYFYEHYEANYFQIINSNLQRNLMIVWIMQKQKKIIWAKSNVKIEILQDLVDICNKIKHIIWGGLEWNLIRRIQQPLKLDQQHLKYYGNF